MQTAAALWSGGKDSALAVYQAREDGIEIKQFVTFIPPQEDIDPFASRYINIVELQAEAANLPLIKVPVGWPLYLNYAEGLRILKNDFGIETIVSGDVAPEANSSNLLAEDGQTVGVTVISPLWNVPVAKILQRLIDLEFSVIFSCVDSRILPEKLVGEEWTRETLSELAVIAQSNGLDLGGGREEYQTLVLAAPFFEQKLQISQCLKSQLGNWRFLDIVKAVLK